MIIAWVADRLGIEHTAITTTVVIYQLCLALRDTARALGWEGETIVPVDPTDQFFRLGLNFSPHNASRSIQ